MTPKELIQLCFTVGRDGEQPVLPLEIPDPDSEDWTFLEHFLIRQRIAPIFYNRIVSNHADSKLPKEFVEALKQAYFQNAARNLYAEKQLTEIITALESHSIPVILLKGGQFNFSIYKNSACRIMSDLDLLVHQESIAEVVSVLETIGYRMSKKPWEGPGHHLPPFSKSDSPFPIEIHSKLTSPSRTTNLPPNEIWKTSQPGSLFGHIVWLLSPTLSLFHVCQHATYHHLFCNAPQAIFDIDTLVRYYGEEINWSLFWHYVEKTNSSQGIAFILNLSNQLLTTPLPSTIINKISGIKFPDGIDENVFEAMSLGQEFPDTPPAGLFNIARWWINKLGKFVTTLIQVNNEGSETNASMKTNLHRSGYILKDNLSASINLLRGNQNPEKIESYRRLRSWLKIR